MNLHEYQGKQLFAEYGLPVSKGYAVESPLAAVEAADLIGGDMWVVKAQVHAGGRGKANSGVILRSGGPCATHDPPSVRPRPPRRAGLGLPGAGR